MLDLAAQIDIGFFIEDVVGCGKTLVPGVLRVWNAIILKGLSELEFAQAVKV